MAVWYVMDVSVGDMLSMQRELQQKYKGIWEPIGPQTASNKLLWGIGEIGEMIDVIKKRGDGIMSDPAVRDHFVEETCDVFMYLSDVLLCYGIEAEDFARIYRAKHAHNMSRRFAGTKYEDREG